MTWLGTGMVDVAPDDPAFVSAVKGWVERPPTEHQRDERRELARQHTWAARASQLLSLVGVSTTSAGTTVYERSTT